MLSLAGPPGGRGTVALLLVVGIALTGGGGAFSWFLWSEGERWPVIATGIVTVVGLSILGFGLGSALARDRLELDRVTATGRWSRTLFGRSIAASKSFEFADVNRVQLSAFVDSAPSGPNGGSGASIEKVRARLLLKRPRTRIDLDEAEIQRIERVRGIAQAVAEMVDTEIEDRTGRS